MTKRQPIPVSVVHKIQQKCRNQDDESRWIIGLLSDTRMRRGEAIGLLKTDINRCAETPHIDLKPHPWRRLKTPVSKRQIPFVGSSLWAAERGLKQHTDGEYACPKYCSDENHKTNSPSTALNKWLKAHPPEAFAVHPFRHSMRDRLRAKECPFDVIDRIGGWSPAGLGSSYGNGYSIEVLSRWMRWVDRLGHRQRVQGIRRLRT